MTTSTNTSSVTASTQFDTTLLAQLGELRAVYPTIDAALAKIAVLSSSLTLPKATVHVISDVHGEYKKLRHVVNNASGTLKPLVQKLLGGHLSEADQVKLLSFIYYPRESYIHFFPPSLAATERQLQITGIVKAELELIRDLARTYPLDAVAAILPGQYIQVFRELILGPQFDRRSQHLDSLFGAFFQHGREMDLLRLTARAVRNLSISELIVAGDLGDRGPRIDKAIEFISRQPNVSITWGNHDAAWMGACLGHHACIASVIRMALRYGSLTQLEEGYGIPLDPLERLVAAVYASDPAARFTCKNTGGRDPLLLGRMQKAISIIQFKIEGQTIERNPYFQLSHRNLLRAVDTEAGTVELDGKRFPLADTYLPTVRSDDPLALTSDEEECIRALEESFTQSPTLWRHMTYMAKKGRMWLRRDRALIFHGCVPSTQDGTFLDFPIDGVPLRGKSLFDAIEVVVQRAFASKRQGDLDLLWYLWGGPLSPLFGKDKISTFESYFIEDSETHHEEKDPYFKLIHTKEYCQKVLAEFGVDSNEGLIVNGHVPVKIEQGESPLKKSGMAVTIDGAFSEAYGDRGYTLALEADRSYLARHHHFESVDDSIRNGTDMIPLTEPLRTHPGRLVADTEAGEHIRQRIALLELLIRAYRENRIESVDS